MRSQRKFQPGFTLVEMIVVMVITGILGGIIAVFIKGPVQGYVDSARRADMTDIADTALSRFTRDARTSLPNSMRVWGAIHGNGSCDGKETCYFEFIPTTGGGRYSETTSGVGYFAVLGPMPDFSSSSSVVINNTSPASVYSGGDVASNVTSAASTVTFASSFAFPSASPGGRFQVISTPVTYVCAPDSSKPQNGTLIRYWGYPIQPAQPHTVATLNGLAAEQNAKLANNVSACHFTLPSAGLVTLYLTISESGDSESVPESISLYATANVANLP